MMTSLLIDGYASEQKAEYWKDVPGYEGIYEASTHGRIRTALGKTTSNARYDTRVWKQRILKPKMSTNKYGRKDARVSLWKDSQESTQLVARLVALTFVDGYFEDATVNHIDGNTLNNSSDNLEWVSRGDNIRLAFSNGLYTTCHKVRLVDAYGLYEEFDSLSEASRYLGRCPSYLSTALRRGKEYCKSCYGETFKVVMI